MKITITGPRSSGKSTISRIVAKKLNLRYMSSDEIAEEYLEKQGGLDKSIKNKSMGYFIKKHSYNLIEEVCKGDDFVLDLAGGAFCSKTYEKISSRIRKLVKKETILVGLLPSMFEERAVNILYNRERKRGHFKKTNDEELFLNTKKDYKKFPHIIKNDCVIVIGVEEDKPVMIAKRIVNEIILLK